MVFMFSFVVWKKKKEEEKEEKRFKRLYWTQLQPFGAAARNDASLNKVSQNNFYLKKKKKKQTSSQHT